MKCLTTLEHNRMRWGVSYNYKRLLRRNTMRRRVLIMVLNLTEAAAFVGVSPPMVSQWLAYGYITKPDGWKRRQGVNIMFEVPHLREIMLVKELRSIRVPQDVIAKHTDVLKQLGAGVTCLSGCCQVGHVSGTILRTIAKPVGVFM